MLFFDSPFTSPYDNLALEEHLFTTLPAGESALLLWQNDNTIVVGKHQNALQEINAAYVRAQGIQVARRLSGGGAVYHDMGNLNFTIITPKAQFEALHFDTFVTPVLETLASFGLTATFTGRNDLTLDGKKFCGNAQYSKGKKLLHHGCIMLHTDLSQVGKALCVNQKKLDAKAVKSVSSRVTTINAVASTPIAMADFKARLQAQVFADAPMTHYALTEADRTAIATLSTEKYATDGWIYHRRGQIAPPKELRFGWGLAQAWVQAEHGQITALTFAGDFFEAKPVEELAARLIGAPLDERLLPLLKEVQVGQYLQGAAAQDLYDLLCS